MFLATAKYLGYSQVQFYVSYNTTQNSMFVEDQLIGNILLRAKRVGRLVDSHYPCEKPLIEKVFC